MEDPSRDNVRQFESCIAAQNFSNFEVGSRRAARVNFWYSQFSRIFRSRIGVLDLCLSSLWNTISTTILDQNVLLLLSGSCSPWTPQPACLERAKGNDQTCLGQAKKLSLHQGVFQFQEWGKQVITHFSQHHKLHLKKCNIKRRTKIVVVHWTKIMSTSWKCCNLFF